MAIVRCGEPLGQDDKYCRRPALFHLVPPPGVRTEQEIYRCREHGEEDLRHFAGLLHEEWTMEPFTQRTK